MHNKISVSVRTRRGHNLLEVLWACMVFAVGLLAVVGIWSMYYRVQAKSRNTLVATNLGRSVMENNLSGGWASFTPIVNNPPTTSTYLSKSQIKGRQVQVSYRVSVQVVDLPATPPTFNDAGFRRLTVTVKWDEDDGTKSVNYETDVYKNS